MALGALPEINDTGETLNENVGKTTTQSVQLVTGGDSTEAGQSTVANLRDILSSTTTGVLPAFTGEGLRDSIVTEASSISNETEATTSPLPPTEAPTEASSGAKASDFPKVSTSTEAFEVEGSGEIAASSDVPTTPVPGPFEHKQQLENDLGPEAVGNPREGCGPIHEDYSQCTIYFKNYLDRVQTWANENNEPMENQYGKVSFSRCYRESS